MIVLWLIVDERIASANDRLVEDIRCMLTQGACFALIDQFSNLLAPPMIEIELGRLFAQMRLPAMSAI